MTHYRLDMDDYRLDLGDFKTSIYVNKGKDIIINFFNFMYAYCEFCVNNHMI